MQKGSIDLIIILVYYSLSGHYKLTSQNRNYNNREDITNKKVNITHLSFQLMQKVTLL